MARLPYCLALATYASLTCFLVRAAEPTAAETKLAELRKQPITTAKGELGDLLTKWWKEGVAAGNAGDFYDNRDGGHSDLNTGPYPQLQRIVYSADEIKGRRHWALTVATRPHVTFGNSSTSAPATQGGSNPRHAYCLPRGLALLAQQYRGNNIYIYPEHRDHDPGHNGRGDGYGDLYPTNTPYLLISQGSSGSDQPFMRAIPFTLAAFRPDVKQKLVENGLLMPTLQMIMRSSNKQLAGPKEYLTGKAHPTVFEGAWVDALKMVKLAHEMTVETLPPLVQLKVLEEDVPANGRDFFEPKGSTEKLGDTPQAIARLWRGKEGRRRMVISAADSLDLNKKPLTFTWVVLRGDEKRIQIKPRNPAGSEVEIVVPYHPRGPVAPGAALESNRVDIGVFAHNGAEYSAPGFVTFCTLDNESRAYDEKGRILEIGFGAGEVDVRVTNYAVLFEALSAADGLPAKMFHISAEQRAALKTAGELHETQRLALESRRAELKQAEAVRVKADAELKAVQARLDMARKANADKPSDETKAAVERATKEGEDAGAVRKKSDDAVKAAQKEVTEAQKKLDGTLAAKQPGLNASVNDFVERTLRQARQDPDLFDTHDIIFRAAIEKAAPARKSAVESARQRLIRSGLASNREGGRLEWAPIRQGSTVLEQRLTPFEKQLIERFNAVLLSELVLPGALTASTSPNFVDQRLFTAKSWRDVYRYDDKDKLTGWVRFDDGRVTEFTEEGLQVLEKDATGRPIKARSVRYEPTPQQGTQPTALKSAPGEEIVTYGYEDGKRVETSRTGAKEER
jgi:hypothetical protein